MRTPENYEHKLFLARDIEDEPNTIGFEVARKINKELENIPTYVGIRLYGSILRGYANINEGSDIDIRVLYNIEEPVEEYEGIHPEDKLLRRAQELELELQGETGTEVVLKPTLLSLQAIERTIQSKDYKTAGEYIGQLTGLIQGKKAYEYRNKVREILSTLPANVKEDIFEAIVERLIWEDGYRRDKWKNRTGFSDDEINKILARRAELWKYRVTKLYQ